MLQPANSDPPQHAGKVLTVSGDPAIRRSLHLSLYEQGYEITEASSGEDALALARIIRFDCVLLDTVLPGKDGIAVCRELRQSHPRLAIVMLTADFEDEYRIRALHSGADDCMIKPVHVRELMARIRAAVRRVQTSAAPADRVVQIGAINLSTVRREVKKAGRSVHLTPKEFDLLAYLMMNPGRAVNHRRLLASVWGAEYSGQLEYLRTFVRQLRRKLEDDPARPKYLLTDNQVGYRFAEAVAA